MDRAGSEWWQGFFTGPWLQVQAAVKGDAEETRREADWLWSALALSPGARVLDVPCGTGRHSVELATRGADVTGIDRSDEVLALARERAAAGGPGLAVRFEAGDMRDVPAGAGFDAAFCWWGSFGYFDDDENARFLRAVAGSLRPGGRFALDTILLESLLSRWQSSSFAASGDVLFGEVRAYDPATGRNESEWHLVTRDRREVRRGSIRLYTYREMLGLLGDAGFGEVSACSDLAGTPWKLGHGRCHFVATRATPEA